MIKEEAKKSSPGRFVGATEATLIEKGRNKETKEKETTKIPYFFSLTRKNKKNK